MKNEKENEKTVENTVERTFSKGESAQAMPLVFTKEDKLAETVGQSKWFNTDCGHDCCTCDSQCK
ncbi:MAG: hypothetical protein IPM81_01850 [Saprospirales bacterium]|nr:hypothetical protein [Saprospirales bacterium]